MSSAKDSSQNSNKTVKEGVLIKQGHVWRSWNRRWFVLTQRNITYSTDDKNRIEKGSYEIDHLSIAKKHDDLDGKTFLFSLYARGSRGTELVMGAMNDQERQEWVDAINQVIQNKKRLLNTNTSHTNTQNSSELNKYPPETNTYFLSVKYCYSCLGLSATSCLTTLLTVSFSTHQSSHIPTFVDSYPPHVLYPYEVGALYTLLLLRCSSTPESFEEPLLLWAVINIPGNDIVKGELAWPFISPLSQGDLTPTHFDK
jgi:hypothetical protein